VFGQNRLVPALPLGDVFAHLRWIFVALLALNILLFLLLVALRENWAFFERRRARVRARLEPVVGQIVHSDDPREAQEAVRGLIATLGVQERPVVAWVLRDMSPEMDDDTRARMHAVYLESGAVEFGERSTGRWMPWRRALACEMLGTMGAERSVPVLVERTEDRRAEVRAAAVRALGAIGSAAAFPRLSEIFVTRSAVPTGIAYDALRGLGDAGTDAFRQGLGSNDPAVCVASCFGVAALAPPSEGLGRLAAVLGGALTTVFGSPP
jgi:HEAT repeats